MDPLLVPWAKPLQHVSTLVRQFLVDFIIITENCVLLGFALSSNIQELKENQVMIVVVLLSFHLVGLILKCVYYRYLHMWAWLIMDYVVKEVHEGGSGHWQCTLISDMFLCGEQRQRNLTLCCLPGPVFRLFKFFCGEKSWGSCGSCSLCGALVGFLLLPIAAILAILALVLAIILIVLFMPVFIVFILPILIVTKCREHKSSDHVMKVSDGEELKGEAFLLAEQPAGGPSHSVTCNSGQ
jgi:hypothetical protein